MDTVVLVEGISDRIALETLAERRGVDVNVVPMGGAHAVRRFLARYVDVRVVGLCDAGEREVFVRAGVEEFEACVADLEDELIRALGPEGVQDILSGHDAAAFRTFQRQPQWRGRPLHDQLRRFLCSSDRRKLRYVPILVEAAAEAGRVPPPLEAVLASAGSGSRRHESRERPGPTRTPFASAELARGDGGATTTRAEPDRRRHP